MPIMNYSKIKPTLILIIVIDFILFSIIIDLVRQPSDISVIVGILIAIVAILANNFLVKYIIKK